jgi:hypothetical protein
MNRPHYDEEYDEYYPATSDDPEVLAAERMSNVESLAETIRAEFTYTDLIDAIDSAHEEYKEAFTAELESALRDGDPVSLGMFIDFALRRYALKVAELKSS